MNKLLLAGLLIIASIVLFNTSSKSINNKSELSLQEKKAIIRTNETTTKTPKDTLKIKDNKAQIEEGLVKQARSEKDMKFLDKDRLILNDLAVLDRMTEDERTEYYKEKELKNVVGYEIDNRDVFDVSYNKAIINKMTKDEKAEYYEKEELKNMTAIEINNNDAIDLPYEVLNPPSDRVFSN